MESYSRGRRGVPAKDVGVERRARVQIPHSPPLTFHPYHYGMGGFFIEKKVVINYTTTIFIVLFFEVLQNILLSRILIGLCFYLFLVRLIVFVFLVLNQSCL